MTYTILDCYTDEPSGLGVPPYLGVYPRYIYGYIRTGGSDTSQINHSLGDAYYLTIDDLRLFRKYNLKVPEVKKSGKTNISIYNLSKNYGDIERILKKTKILIVILGVHTPGKYLSARPGTLREVKELIKNLNCKKILTGPAVYGTSVEGGRFFEKTSLEVFDEIKNFNFSYDEINKYCLKGAEVIKQIDNLRIVEIETSRGCKRGKGCSFCTEPLKSKFEHRKAKDVFDEVKKFYGLGVRHFRIGKQSCFYSYPEASKLIKSIKEQLKVKVLHIDNVNPVFVNEKLTKDIVKYCTEGNVAAFGVESFDEKVIKENNLNCNSEDVLRAVKIINKYGSKRGVNGMPYFLPGINLLYGLKGESKETFVKNFENLKSILDSGLLLRRINIRKVVLFEGTELYNKVGNKFLRKNRRHYYSATKKIREEIDFEMLKKVVPKETILKDLRTEIYDGNTTFCRQLGTYPLIVGVKGRIKLDTFINVKIKDWMLRSVVGESV